MRLKYYLRGLGTGIILATLVLTISFSLNKTSISDEEVKERALKLGMVLPDENETISEDKENESEDSDIKDENAKTIEAAKKEAEKEKQAEEKELEKDKVADASDDTFKYEKPSERKNNKEKSDADENTADKKSINDKTADNKNTDSKIKENKATDTKNGKDKITTSNDAASATTKKESALDKKYPVNKELATSADREVTKADEFLRNYNKNVSSTPKTKVENYIPFTISAGQTSSIVSTNLYKAGLVDDSDKFNKYLNSLGVDSLIQGGTFYVSDQSSYDDIVAVLVTKQENRTNLNPPKPSTRVDAKGKTQNK